MTMNELLTRVRKGAKYNQANKVARANGERLLATTGAKTMAEALVGRKNLTGI